MFPVYVVIPIVIFFLVFFEYYDSYKQNRKNEEEEEEYVSFEKRREKIWSYFIDDYKNAQFLKIRGKGEETRLVFKYGHYLIQVEVNNSKDDSYKNAETVIWTRKDNHFLKADQFNDVVLVGIAGTTKEKSNILAKLLIEKYYEETASYNHNIEDWWHNRNFNERKKISKIPYDAIEYRLITDNWWNDLSLKEKTEVYKKFA